MTQIVQANIGEARALSDTVPEKCNEADGRPLAGEGKINGLPSGRGAAVKRAMAD
jgi:hypothetical protein